MSDEIEIRVSVKTSFVHSKDCVTFKVDKEEWESMTDVEQNDYCMEVMFELIEWNWEIIE